MDYLFVGRARRVTAVSNSLRKPQASRSCTADARYLATRWRQAVLRLWWALCFKRPPACKESLVDIGSHSIVLYESTADEKTTERGIATRLWRCWASRSRIQPRMVKLPKAALRFAPCSGFRLYMQRSYFSSCEVEEA